MENVGLENSGLFDFLNLTMYFINISNRNIQKRYLFLMVNQFRGIIKKASLYPVI